MVAETVVPPIPEVGAIAVTVGGCAEMVNPPGRDALVSPGLVTTTFHAPARSVDDTANLQVIVVGETTTTSVAGISSQKWVVGCLQLSMTSAPGWNPVPVMVTGTVVPRIPVFGVISATVSGA